MGAVLLSARCIHRFSDHHFFSSEEEFRQVAERA
jgi:hypothetical protein